MSTDAAVQNKPRPGLAALTEDGWRHARRIALASMAGLATAKLLGWPYGAFFAFYPIVLVGLVPALNARVVVQFTGSSLAGIAIANLLVVLAQLSPVLATIMFFAVAARCFRMMALDRGFLFHALTILSTSLLVHLATYPQIVPRDLYTAHFIATLLSVAFSVFVYVWLPERRAPTSRNVDRTSALINHRMLLGAICATASYVAFQVIDLRDSLSAQAASVLVLFPMTLAGGRWAACTRVAGTLLGSAYVLAMQLLLYTHVTRVLLLLPIYAAGVTLFATLHVRENSGSAIGLSAATAVAVLVGQLMPSADLYGISLYRFVSVFVAVCTMLLCIYLTHAVLNRFEATRIPTT